MIATQAAMAVGNSAKEDGSIINQLLKLAVIALVIIFLIGIAFWAFIIISNWDGIKAFLQVLYTFFGGGLLALLNPYDTVNRVVRQKTGTDLGNPTNTGIVQVAKSGNPVLKFLFGLFGK